jgi:sphingomyelin phosphodiesterase acid-like 3
VAYVAQQLHATFPKVPIYFALGNNDSGCKDYREDENSAYLQGDGRTFSEVVLDKANARGVLKEFSALGDYKVQLPAPFANTHLLVMQDIFESKKYTTCGGKESAREGTEQTDWLRKQLDEARSRHEHIWVMAHIPPGVDAYNTVTKSEKKDAAGCSYSKPEMFLNSELFADTLRDYTDVISLVLLGHTHMDEMRIYTAKSGSGSIPGKLVPSTSPVDGNNPSFTVGSANPDTATLIDYSVFAADNQTGVGTKWSLEYTYSATYGMPDYSAASITKLTSAFLADPRSQGAKTQSYESFYFVGGPSAGINLKAAAMKIIWPVYACSITHDHAKSFSDCACPTK